jgi:hypothetical protein
MRWFQYKRAKRKHNSATLTNEFVSLILPRTTLSNRTFYNDFSKALLALETFFGNSEAVCTYSDTVLDIIMATRLANLRG